MATLTVFKFAAPEGANQMLDKVTSLQKMELIKIQDAAIVTWPAVKKPPRPSSWSTWPVWAPCKAPSGACSSA